MPDPMTNPPTDVAASRASFRLEYDGPALADGAMDVRELGRALTAVGELIEHANRIINADRASVVVNAQSRFEGGSFDVALEVLQTLAAQGALPEHVKDVPYLLAVLGFADTGTISRAGVSVWKLLKWLKDKVVTEKQTNPQTGTVTIKAGENARIEVHQHVVVVAEDVYARQAIDGVVHPLHRSGIERLRIAQLDDRVIEEVRRDEIPPLPSTALDVLREFPVEKRVAVVEVVKPAFQENMAWEFSEGGGRSFPAVVKDPDFVARVTHRGRLFGAGDLLKVRLESKKSQTQAGLRTDITVVEVLEEIPFPALLIERGPDEGVAPKRLPGPRRKTRKRQSRRGRT